MIVQTEELAVVRDSTPYAVAPKYVPYARAKRIFDIVGSLAMLALFALPIIIVYIALRLTRRDCVIFCQERFGLGGKPFVFYKFATMQPDSERQFETLMRQRGYDKPEKIANDPRITPLGRVLRVLSLDELPQLWNVLKGEMSLVGPRPLTDAEVGHMTEVQLGRHAIKPGLTGLAQIMGRSNIPFDMRMQFDLAYMEVMSLGYDLMIVLLSIPLVLSRRGAR